MKVSITNKFLHSVSTMIGTKQAVDARAKNEQMRASSSSQNFGYSDPCNISPQTQCEFYSSWNDL